MISKDDFRKTVNQKKISKSGFKKPPKKISKDLKNPPRGQKRSPKRYLRFYGENPGLDQK